MQTQNILHVKIFPVYDISGRDLGVVIIEYETIRNHIITLSQLLLRYTHLEQASYGHEVEQGISSPPLFSVSGS